MLTILFNGKELHELTNCCLVEHNDPRKELDYLRFSIVEPLKKVGSQNKTVNSTT